MSRATQSNIQVDSEARAPAQGPCASQWEAVNNFLRWLERSGYESYDPYDIWGTKYGVFARRLYYRNSLLGLPLVAPVLLMEILCPQWRGLFVTKRRYATADAQLALAFLNLYGLTHQRSHLHKAEGLCRDLLRYSVPGYAGYCWGYPFDWECCHRFYTKGTPFITTTPYCFEAFLSLYAATQDPQHLEVAASIAQFVFTDLGDVSTGPNSSAASYSTVEKSKVINASAYRAFVLFEAAAYRDLPDYREKAWRNLNFILESQRPDGGWLYSLDNPAEAFVDHFHTCFVLKNLCKINQRLKSSAVESAITRGYAYYRRELFDEGLNPKSFAIAPRTQIVRLEMYNLAEAVTLGVLLRNLIPEAFAMAQQLGRRIIERYQLDDGHFITREYSGGLTHRLAFLRWPQAQLFYALTNLLAAGQKTDDLDLAEKAAPRASVEPMTPA